MSLSELGVNIGQVFHGKSCDFTNFIKISTKQLKSPLKNESSSTNPKEN